MNTKYLDLLAQKYDTEEKVVTEIINLEAILHLPKGTEHFVSDLHGEYQAFQHVLRNGSGNVKEKIKDLFKNVLSDKEINEFATLVYYPEEKLPLIKAQFRNKKELYQWYTEIIDRMLNLISYASSKYTRSKLRKALPDQFVYIIEELLYKTDEFTNKEQYYTKIVQQIISLGQADKLIIGLAYTTQRLVVDHLHVVGDIYDRGPEPDKIMDTLINYHSVDIQWGNHDVLWLGAFAGSKVCLANIIRICARYDNLDIIEDVYGINLRPLLNLAEKYYDDNPAFRPKVSSSDKLSDHERLQITKIHQAIAMIQFKLESPIIKRRPFFNMSERLLLEKIDYDKNEITIYGNTYQLENSCFATINPAQPDQLLEEEEQVMERLLLSVQHSEKLARHMKFLMKKGSLYLKYNGNLLIHGCIPLDEEGNMEKMTIEDKTYAGRNLLDVFEHYLQEAFAHPEETDDLATDMVWYLWTGEYSSLFGKRAMTTFERYFISDKATHKEKKNPYYYLRENEEVCRNILEEFKLNPDHGHIINGHTPVKEIEGENPVKANGKMIVIDGGFSKAYQSTTGIAGYTLLYNSYGMQLVAHKHFNSKEEILLEGTDVLSVKRLVDKELERKMVLETNVGEELLKEISILKDLRKYRYS
ncbi:fructose-1,6-bisphosphatase [Priestia megaterium]|uniref:Fructose-1,6-bisphosphatase class 3 n=2 Tax=Priestia megaterium TaxID=1404 RepID=D5DHB9_PRIM3|nr:MULTISPECIES: fructose-1,6-bisphosphatase [Priestia]ADF40240.1 fructose-1,6-bisphosphatase [Priestia megaterium DSM 319]AJI24048.1 fructose-1,6-bisphosphatase class 3 [Priestia megaterium NBRC 15308 = ATCC 14581]AYE50188.1 fructose-1,6-bisphosphatase [Priestia megaterium NCT-2]KFN05477.1 fructose-1,6-bisphosphatase class 3 [Priestia megaterium]KGJ77243.1 fructose 1,6-bisphosphatase [Priestia megaterium NBRC 15308 = ATCC 14581]